MKPISSKQQEILAYITDFTFEQGYPPSVREIGMAVGLRSPSSVHAHLKKLREWGYLEKEDYKTRALALSSRADIERVPILGRVTAGMPILAVQEEIGCLHVDLGGRSGNYFALCIRGDSMIGAGILDGDYIIVRQQNFAEEGQIVVALLEDEATCKRLHQEDGHLWLLPENPDYSPIPGDECRILGVVVRCIRDYPA